VGEPPVKWLMPIRMNDGGVHTVPSPQSLASVQLVSKQ
jgi:hypothetical protein